VHRATYPNPNRLSRKLDWEYQTFAQIIAFYAILFSS